MTDWSVTREDKERTSLATLAAGPGRDLEGGLVIRGLPRAARSISRSDQSGPARAAPATPAHESRSQFVLEPRLSMLLIGFDDQLDEVMSHDITLGEGYKLYSGDRADHPLRFDQSR